MRLPYRTRVALGTAAVTTALVMIPVAASAASAAARPAVNGFPAHYAAPYLQISSGDAGDMAADMKASGDKYYTLAFLTPKNGSGCVPLWEDNNQALNNAGIVSAVKSLQAAGGQVLVSLGGASGGEPAETCGSVSSLEAEYAKIVTTIGTGRLDFDIEGSAGGVGVFSPGEAAINARRDQALAMLQKANPAVQVDFTLPVNPNGLPTSHNQNEVGFLKNAVSAGVKINLVNIMTMDFGNGQNVLADSEEANTDTAKQLESVFGTGSPDYAKLGLTPIAGKNDDNENFTQADAHTLEGIAATDGVSELSFWEVQQYDRPAGFAYSKIFNQITG